MASSKKPRLELDSFPSQVGDAKEFTVDKNNVLGTGHFGAVFAGYRTQDVPVGSASTATSGRGRKKSAKKADKDAPLPPGPFASMTPRLAVKIDKLAVSDNANNSKWVERDVLQVLAGRFAPRLYFAGVADGDPDPQPHRVLVMDAAGPTLDEAVKRRTHLTLPEVLSLGRSLVSMLRCLHSTGYIHGDVKPQNFLLPQGQNVDKGVDLCGAELLMVDLGLASKWRKEAALPAPALPSTRQTGGTAGGGGGGPVPAAAAASPQQQQPDVHISYAQQLAFFRGTVRYASMNVHFGRTMTRRDDMESLLYVLLYMLSGKLPWQGLPEKGDDKKFAIGREKALLLVSETCQGCPVTFRGMHHYLACVRTLSFTQEPDYDYLLACLTPNGPTAPVPSLRSSSSLGAAGAGSPAAAVAAAEAGGAEAGGATFTTLVPASNSGIFIGAAVVGGGGTLKGGLKRTRGDVAADAAGSLVGGGGGARQETATDATDHVLQPPVNKTRKSNAHEEPHGGFLSALAASSIPSGPRHVLVHPLSAKSYAWLFFPALGGSASGHMPAPSMRHPTMGLSGVGAPPRSSVAEERRGQQQQQRCISCETVEELKEVFDREVRGPSPSLRAEVVDLCHAEGRWHLLLQPMAPDRPGAKPYTCEMLTLAVPESSVYEDQEEPLRRWVRSHWTHGYNITRVAANCDTWVLIACVMPQERSYQKQAFTVHCVFPSKWVKEKWGRGYHVTSVGCVGGSSKQQWTVVMSKETGFQDQRVEIHHNFPVEGVR